MLIVASFLLPLAMGAGAAARATTGGAASDSTKTRTWWQHKLTGPNEGPEFQWELDRPLNLHSRVDLGQDVTNGIGQTAPNPTLYDIDGIENSASTVAALHRRSDRVI